MSEPTKPSPSHLLSPAIEDKDVYKALLDTRNFEISLFWQRSNYFLALNTALAIGAFTQKPTIFLVCLAGFGVVASMLWFFVALGSKYWQSRWEQKLSEAEDVVAPALRAFSSTSDERKESVSRSMEHGGHTGFQAWIDKQVLKKPSVSYCMTLLSLMFLAAWSAFFIFALFVGAWRQLPEDWGAIGQNLKPPAIAKISETQVQPLPFTCASAPSISANPTVSVNVNLNDKTPPSPRKPLPPSAQSSASCRGANLIG